MDPGLSDGVETLTLDEYGGLPDDDRYRDELVRGRLVREPRPGGTHARLVVRLAARMEAFAEEHDLGSTYADAGFVLAVDPPTVRGPDIAFLSREAVRREGTPTGFWRVPPDLAVEIVSPSNTSSEIQEKVLEYLDAGTKLVWVVDPKPRTVTVYRPGVAFRILREDDILDGGDLLPGFRLSLSDLFSFD